MITCLPRNAPSRPLRLLAAAAAVASFFPAAAAVAECDGIARLPLVPQEPEIVQANGPGLICFWQTEASWVPPETCGNIGFEVVGWGERPLSVEFKRRNTYYAATWQTQVTASTDDGAPVWTSASLDAESIANRCAVGWCKPKNYQLRTSEPVSEDVCSQPVELRIRMTDQVEF